MSGLAIAALWSGLLTSGALAGVAMFSITWLVVAVAWLAAAHRAFVVQALRSRGSGGSLARVQWRTGGTWLVLWAWMVPMAVMISFGPPQ